MKKSLCLIVTYFGKWPEWFPFYLESCKFNPDVNWIIFTDCPLPEKYPENVKFVNFSLKDFNILASTKLNLKINISKPYKYCDFRPAAGVIFEDYIKGYDFWGHTEIDIIYGNIRKFLTEEMLEKFDVITSLKDLTAGHFTIYRNVPKIKNLYKLSNEYQEVFLSDKYFGFEECYVFGKKITENSKLSDIKGYNITAIIKKESQKKNISSIFIQLCRDAGHPAECSDLIFNKGTLVDKKLKEYMYFHFSKIRKYCKISQLEKEGSFSIENTLCTGLFSRPKRIIIFSKYVISLKIVMVMGQIGILMKKISPSIYQKLKKQTFIKS